MIHEQKLGQCRDLIHHHGHEERDDDDDGTCNPPMKEKLASVGIRRRVDDSGLNWSGFDFLRLGGNGDIGRVGGHGRTPPRGGVAIAKRT